MRIESSTSAGRFRAHLASACLRVTKSHRTPLGHAERVFGYRSPSPRSAARSWCGVRQTSGPRFSMSVGPVLEGTGTPTWETRAVTPRQRWF